MPAHDTQLERIRKLLAKAEDPAVTAEEAELYNTKAAELIARYGVDNAMLAATGHGTDDITVLTIPIDNPYSRDKASLLTNIAYPLRCRTLLHRVGQGVESVTVFGFKSDLGRVELLFTSLLLQASTQLTRVRPDARIFRESLAAYRRTWLHGFARAVHERLVRAETTAAREHPGSGRHSAELVVRDRTALVQTAFDREYGDLRAAGPRRLSGSGYREGHQAGTRATLDPAALTRRRQALPVR
ncbi:DUF2786 domain-containing protein [Amycolatopsis sp. FDAARGOS 1241]|uniref:DUF2786 domain-containing protein n=1 Tax=Amycolatopsis sp. FDAARGOS 1241 TaxID=2778070 RepID=UPI00194EB39E|nr:DUF2786 domain-containing protein [Amycolatopsis sp. FDAARGOS 1241]QRP46980.1 DUF2786 domain-containing protein [Amycolatopsis sp. FDAARGOS 1241]